VIKKRELRGLRFLEWNAADDLQKIKFIPYSLSRKRSKKEV